MTPAERTAKIAKLRAEADRLERDGDFLAKAVNGALFRSYGKIVMIPPRIPVGPALALDGDAIGCECYGWSEDPNLEYLGHARDLLTIKTPDAPEPTGAELVGKVCIFCDSDFGTFSSSQSECRGFGPRGYQDQRGVWWRNARLHKEQK